MTDQETPSGLPPAYDSNPAARPAPAPVPSVPVPPRNPFVGALCAIGSIVLAVGIIIVIVGVANAASYEPSSFGGGRDSGAGETALGTLLCNVGGLVLIAGLVVAGVDWSIRTWTRRND